MKWKRYTRKLTARFFALLLMIGILYVPSVFGEATILKTWTTQGDFENNDVSQQRPTTRTNVDTSSFPGDVIIDQMGELIGPEVVTNTRIAHTNAIAFNSTDNEYMVVWQDDEDGEDDIYAQRISADGSLIGAEIAVSNDSNARTWIPRIAYNSTANQFMVTWYDARRNDDIYRNNFEIYAQIVNADGSLSGPEILVGTDDDVQRYQAIAYNSVNDEYMITWEGNRGGTYDIYAQIVSSEGVVLPNTEIKITDSSSIYEYNPDIIYNPVQNQFLVAWHENGPTDAMERDIHAQLVNADGSLSGSEITINADPLEQKNPRISFNTTTEQYMVTWVSTAHYSPTIYYIMAQIVDSNGSLVDSEITVSSNRPNQFNPEISYNPNYDQYMITYNGSTVSFDVYAQRVNANGTLLGNEIDVCTADAAQTVPVIAANPSANEFMLSWIEWRDGNQFKHVRSQRVKGDYSSFTGTITDLTINSGVKTPFWRKLHWNADTPEGTEVYFRTRSAGKDSDLENAEWSEYYTVSGSDVFVDSKQWLEVEMTLESLNGGNSPVVHDFTIEFSNERSGGKKK